MTAGIAVCNLLLLGQVLVNGSCALLTCTHGQNDGGSAGDSVAAGENAVAGGHLVLIDDQATLAVGLQTGSGGANQGVGAGAQGHDDGVHIQHELGIGDLDGTAAAGSVGLTQLHTDALHAADTAVFTGHDLDGIINSTITAIHSSGYILQNRFLRYSENVLERPIECHIKKPLNVKNIGTPSKKCIILSIILIGISIFRCDSVCMYIICIAANNLIVFKQFVVFVYMLLFQIFPCKYILMKYTYSFMNFSSYQSIYLFVISLYSSMRLSRRKDFCCKVCETFLYLGQNVCPIAIFVRPC